MRTGFITASIIFLILSGCTRDQNNISLPQPEEESHAPAPEKDAEENVPEQKETLTLTFVGDIIAHEPNYTTDDYSRIYAGLEGRLLKDDLTFGNIEYPMVPEKPQASFPIFNIHPEYTRAAAEAGVDVFSLANNHTLDQGGKGAVRTREVMEEITAGSERQLYASGIRKEGEDLFIPAAIQYAGWEIGFIAVTQFTNIVPEEGTVTDYIYLVDGSNRDEFLNMVKKTSGNYDLFIVSYHGDMIEEYVFEPNPDKEAFFRDLMEAGADIIYGHHPHVLQPYEIVESEGRNGLILYSVGNLISGQGFLVHHTAPDPTDSWAYTHDSAIFTVTVEKQPNGPHVSRVEPLLIGNYIVGYEPPDKAVLIYPLEQLTLMGINSAWRNYYRERYRIMSSFLSESRRYSKMEYGRSESEVVSNSP